MMHSIYNDFMDSARLAPKNAKLILRHSLRDKIPKGSMGENVLLTREGVRLVEHFGRNFTFDISRIHTSVIGRCVQTAEVFAKNYMDNKGFNGEDSIVMLSEKKFIESRKSKSKDSKNIESKKTDSNLQIIKTHILSDSYINDMKAAKWLFAKHSPYYIMQEFLRGGELKGMRNKEEAMRILFSYIFSDIKDSTIDSKQKMEIFITHDTFLIAIICYCFGIVPLNPASDDDFSTTIIKNDKSIDSSGFAYMKDGKIEQFTWPFMLEGAFLYYENNRIYCIFRGQIGSVEFRF